MLAIVKRYKIITTRCLLLLLLFLLEGGSSFAQKYVSVYETSASAPNMPSTFAEWKETANYPRKRQQIIKQNVPQDSQHASKWRHETYQLYYNDIPVEFCILKTHYENGILQSVNGYQLIDCEISTTPTISEDMAFERAIEYIDATTYIWDLQDHELKKPHAQLVICPSFEGNDTIAHLAYKYTITAIDPQSIIDVYVDAHNGKILLQNNRNIFATGIADTKYSGIQSIETKQVQPNQFCLIDEVRGGGITTEIVGTYGNELMNYSFCDNDNIWSSEEYASYQLNAVLDAHWGSEVTYDYYWETFGRNSIDNDGFPINVYVYLDYRETNAYWSTANQYLMLFGGGSQSTACTALDVVSHEITHGLTSFTSNLVYRGESGAINEAISDIFAICVKNYADIGKNLWLIGDEVSIYGDPLRDVQNPHSKETPNTYEGTYWIDPSGTFDEGGVHFNSLVFSHWFYLLVEGGEGINDNGDTYDVVGIGFADAEQIVYNACVNFFCPLTNFHTAAELTIESVIELYGICSVQAQSVIDAFNAVGIECTLEIPDEIVIEDGLHNNFINQYVARHITASNIIFPDAVITYSAEEDILILPNFEARQGCDLSLKIGSCDDGNNVLSAQQRLKREPSSDVPPNYNVTTQYGEYIGMSIIDTEQRWSLYDIWGRLLKTSNSVDEIKIISLPPGYYILQECSEGQKHTHKFHK